MEFWFAFGPLLRGYGTAEEADDYATRTACPTPRMLPPDEADGCTLEKGQNHFCIDRALDDLDSEH